MDENIKEVSSQNVIKSGKKIEIIIEKIPLFLGLLSFLLVFILVIKQKMLNHNLVELQEKIERLDERQKNTYLKLTDVDETLKNEAIPTINPDIYTCDYWKDKVFDETEFGSPAGTLIVTGSIVKKEGIKYFTENEKITRVYLSVSEPKENPQKLFYETYLSMVAGGNTINDNDGPKLLFKLGMLENSHFIPGLSMSSDLNNKIMSLIDKNETIKLKLTIGIPQGRSGGDGESFACTISE